jgi:thioredoxin-like negative regulator of GroEL
MVKYIVFILALLTFALTAMAQNEQIVWENDFKKAQQAARENGKPLMLDFTASWCKPCKAMDEQFWIRADVIEAVKPFIAVKIDYDNEKSLVGKYNVQAIPFVAFADPLGNMITFRRGFSSKNVNELHQIFDEMPKDFSALKKYYDAIELKKDDGPALLQIADSYRAAKMLYLSNNFYKKALKTDEIKNDSEKKERIGATLGLNSYAIRDFEQAIEFLEDYLKDFPAGKYSEIALAQLAISNAHLGKMKNANKYLEMLKTGFPESKNIPAVIKAMDDAKNKRDK